MILTVYGDRFSAAAHVARPYAWAIEDHWNNSRGRRAHPDNIPHGFAYRLSQLLHVGFHAGSLKDSTVEEITDQCIHMESQNPDKNMFVIAWGKEHTQDINDINMLGLALEDTGIKHCFINSEDLLTDTKGRWLWDPSKQTIRSWAEQNGYMRGDNLSLRGHSVLANLCLERLTNQYSNLIVVE